jgi:hypothetical protein
MLNHLHRNRRFEVSIDAARICCTGCDFEAAEVFEPLRIVCRLDDGKEVESCDQDGWCSRCDTYTLERQSRSTARLQLRTAVGRCEKADDRRGSADMSVREYSKS